MSKPEEPEREVLELRERLSRLSEASLRINESLDFDTVLQGVLDSARSLTGARYGVITLLDDQGRPQDFLSSGMSGEEARLLWELPDGPRLFECLSGSEGPLRLPDLAGYFRSAGLPEFRPPLPAGGAVSFLAAPVLHRDERVGNVYVAAREDGGEFTHVDEETLVMFAAQAALVIANARRHRDERRARADLETLIDTSPVGVVVFDAATGAPVSFNREAGRLVDSLREPEQPPEQLLKVLTVRRGDGREVSLAELPMARALAAGETVRAEEITLAVPDGRSVTALVNATPIRSEQGELESFVVTLQDLAPLEELERLRAEFLGMVSHELRTPLTSIKGSVTTLLEASSELDPAEMTQFHRIIRDQADQMRHLIGDLLDVARIETGTLPVAPGPADIADIIDDARNRFLAAGGTDSLQIDLAPGLPPVTADRRRIAQVLANLLANAARHSPHGSPIRLGAAQDGTHVAVTVTDQGTGIPPERLPHLFRKFSRHDSDDPETAGAGLGLAICKGIVEAHGGRIWAQSDGPDRGARLTFTIPATDTTDTGTDSPAGPAPAAARSRRAARGQPRILAVDDDPQTLRYVRGTLTEAGYTPLVTGDPNDVPRLIHEEKPQLVLLDLMLPGTDGIELMKQTLHPTGVPVIFLSAYGQEEYVSKAFEAGAADYIVKPFSPTELTARIKAALRKQAAPQQAEPAEPYRHGDLTVNYSERWVTLAGRPLQLTATEYDVLHHLSANAGRVLTHNQILQQVWGPGTTGQPGLVRNVIKRLRQKLQDNARNPTYIHTQPRVGYRMAKPTAPRQEET